MGTAEGRRVLLRIYRRLLRARGPAGWWPGRDGFEISVGAVLTQNTAWTNVEKALAVLRSRGLLSHAKLRAMTAEEIARAPAFSISDVLAAVPGVTLAQGNGPRDVSISVRGSNARQTYGVRNLVVFEDDFPVTQPDGLARTDLTDPHAYERIDVMQGPSSALYGNYAIDSGQILVRHEGQVVDIGNASPRTILDIRHRTIGYVSQFLRTVPRVAAIDVVAEPLLARKVAADEAREHAAMLLSKLNLPRELWSLPPATFSGGEQQRVNIARGFITDHAILLLDEPTASLDALNRRVVVDMIVEKKQKGTALLGIFHDEEVREAVADRILDVSQFSPRKAAA